MLLASPGPCMLPPNLHFIVEPLSKEMVAAFRTVALNLQEDASCPENLRA